MPSLLHSCTVRYSDYYVGVSHCLRSSGGFRLHDDRSELLNNGTRPYLTELGDLCSTATTTTTKYTCVLRTSQSRSFATSHAREVLCLLRVGLLGIHIRVLWLRIARSNHWSVYMMAIVQSRACRCRRARCSRSGRANNTMLVLQNPLSPRWGARNNELSSSSC